MISSPSFIFGFGKQGPPLSLEQRCRKDVLGVCWRTDVVMQCLEFGIRRRCKHRLPHKMELCRYRLLGVRLPVSCLQGFRYMTCSSSSFGDTLVLSKSIERTEMNTSWTQLPLTLSPSETGPYKSVFYRRAMLEHPSLKDSLSLSLSLSRWHSHLFIRTCTYQVYSEMFFVKDSVSVGRI